MARPSVDPRYALGLCESCSRFAKPRGGQRPDGLDPSKLQPLVRAKDWDADAFAARRQAERERRVIAHPRNEAEHVPGPVGDHEVDGPGQAVDADRRLAGLALGNGNHSSRNDEGGGTA